jgi:fucose permease
MFPGFDLYSFITVGAVIVMGGVGGAMVEPRFAGLVERIAAIVTQQWLFVLGLTLLLH